MKKTGHDIKCIQCGSSKYISGWEFKKGRGKYCTRKCYQISEKGRINPDIKGLKLGHGWNKGKRVIKVIGLKRDEVKEYRTIHEWIEKERGRPDKCGKCGAIGKIEWANKSQEYKKDPLDWIALCRSCHREFDSQFYLGGKINYV